MKNTNTEITIHDSITTIQDNPWKQKTEWLEYDLAVKWFSVEARLNGELCGFMHVIRHPGKENEWFSCDVFTMDPYRRHGIATAMYEEAMKRLQKYFRANRMTASIKNDNEASVKLHEKIGFRNTHEASVFPGFTFEPDETVFEHWFAKAYPARDLPIHRQILSSLAGDEADDVLNALKVPDSVFILWAGSEAIGCRIGSSTILLPEWERRSEDYCLSIR